MAKISALFGFETAIQHQHTPCNKSSYLSLIMF
jgi:hypothetical protein